MSMQHTEVEITNHDSSYLARYPLDLPASPDGEALDEPYAGEQPGVAAQQALGYWNRFLSSHDTRDSHVFLAQARWFVEHETRIGQDAGGWPIVSPQEGGQARGPWLSARVQGMALSLLGRAYHLSHDEAFLESAHRAARTFERDILDGGVHAPVGTNGVFFESTAIYPADHNLHGSLCALLGLHDYAALTHSRQAEELLERGLATLDTVLEEFDTGYWTRSDLLHRALASPPELAFQVALLEALARNTRRERYAISAARWKTYGQSFGTRLRYRLKSRLTLYARTIWNRGRTKLFPITRTPEFPLRTCISLPAFPVTGGVLSVVENIVQVTQDVWQIEYLTKYAGPHSRETVIYEFATPRMAPSNFPFVWFYTAAGFRKLFSLLRRGVRYDLILPQDAAFTAAFCALVGKLAGAHVVCIDHGHLTLLQNRPYKVERKKSLAQRSWLRRAVWSLQELWYLPSLRLQARFAAPFVDHYLVPGIVGDGVEDAARRVGIPGSRITRFASMVDVERHIVLDAPARAQARTQKGLAPDAIVVAIVCRLSPEKGLEVALESMGQALARLSPTQRSRVRLIIAGDGPLRQQVEAQVQACELDQVCELWGDLSAQEVIALLAISDIFLYTSTRGACFAMAILEAMASGCAVIASTQPPANAPLLSEGRGIAVESNNVAQTSAALVQLLSDVEGCHHMGHLARNYVASQHSAAMFRRTLLRVTPFQSSLAGFLSAENSPETLVGDCECS